MNTTENNKLIAEFMGEEISIPKYSGGEEDWSIIMNGDKIIQTNVRYNSSWEWLMPVFEKIGSLTNQHGFNFTWSVGKYTCIESNNYSVIEKKFFANSDTPIISAYNCALKFIKWYNENKES